MDRRNSMVFYSLPRHIQIRLDVRMLHFQMPNKHPLILYTVDLGLYLDMLLLMIDRSCDIARSPSVFPICGRLSFGCSFPDLLFCQFILVSTISTIAEWQPKHRCIDGFTDWTISRDVTRFPDFIVKIHYRPFPTLLPFPIHL